MKSLKKVKVEHIVLFVVGALFLLFLINSYSNNKFMGGSEQMSSRRTQEMCRESSRALARRKYT